MTFTLTCMAGELARALSLVSQVTGKEKQVPILKAVRIHVERGSASVSATNNDHGATVTFAAEGDGTAYIDAALIAPKSKVLRPGQPVEIVSKTGKTATIKQGVTEWKLPLLADGDDTFPIAMTEPVPGDPISMTAGPLLRALAVAPDAIWAGVGKTADMGALLDMGEERFRVISTNGKVVLSVVEIDAPTLPATVVIPNGAMATLRSMFGEADELQIVANTAAMSASCDGVTYRTKLVEGHYPNWRGVVTTQAGPLLDGEATADTSAILETIDRAAAIAGIGGTDVLAARIKIAGGEFSISTKNRNGEEGHDVCPCAGTDGQFTIPVSFMRKMIANIGSKTVTLRYSTTDHEKPVAIHAVSADRDDYRLVMPMRDNQ